MLVLREDFKKGVRGQVRANGLEGKARLRFAFHPEVDRWNFMAPRHDGAGQIELAVELERPRLNRQSALGGAGLRRLVHDAHLDAELGQPERQNKARGPRANNQNIATRHLAPLIVFAWKIRHGNGHKA